MRLAVYGTELSRKGPGLLLRDIRKGEDPQITAVAEVIAGAQADIIFLTGIDYDAGGVTLGALADRISEAGWDYPHRFALRPNTGMPTGFDLDGDGRNHRAGDAQSWALYSGQGGVALLSRWPVDQSGLRDFSTLLWRDLPEARLPRRADGAPYFAEPVLDVLRLATTAHWHVPIQMPNGTQVTLLTFKAGPPVFDGPEDRNGLRNADEIRFWQLLLDGHFGPAPTGAWALLGTANVDPVDGEGHHGAITALLTDPRLQDPQPRSIGGTVAANPSQNGDPGLDTVDWWEEDNGPGNLRVDYILPAAELVVQDSGVIWSDPETDPDAATREATASRHRLIWVDLALPE